MSAPVAEVVLRRYSVDGQLHAYLAEKSRDRGEQFLVPMGHEFPYPEQHGREDLSAEVPGTEWDTCEACQNGLDYHHHVVVVVSGEVAV